MQLPTFSDKSIHYQKFGLNQDGWLCTCTIHGVEGEFPREGYGVEEGEDPPTFQNKKVWQCFPGVAQ
jgi:hypothetical protein